MAKKQFIIKIIGLDKHDNPARTGDDVVAWANDTKQFEAWSDGINMFVNTCKGTTKLTPHTTNTNLWTGVTDGGIKMHTTLKKITGKIIYWM